MPTTKFQVEWNSTIAQTAKGKNMRKEMLKGSTMIMLTVVLAFAGAVISANAQSSGKASAAIPFDFAVGNQTLASGEYRVAPISSDGEALVIRNADTGKSVMRLSRSIAPRANQTQARLVFHKYGQRYFLAEVWAGGDTLGRQVLESREERAIRREHQRLALNSYETVELLASVR